MNTFTTTAKRLIFIVAFVIPFLSLAQNQTVSKSQLDNSLWLHWDDGVYADSWGFFLGAANYDVAQKWDPSDISAYDEWKITKIKFYVVNSNPTITIKVWEGTAANEIYSQDVSSFNVNTWTEVDLTTPVIIDASTQLWAGYNVDMPFGDAVVGTDNGPAEDEYGNLYRSNGVWYSDYNNNLLQIFIEPNLNADFEADATEICVGSTVNFTNLSTSADTYLWTFEGGTPSTSTDENPSVVYNTPGVYDVTLQATFGSETDTQVYTDYISVLETPAKADMPTGENDVCTGLTYFYETSELTYATDYEWELSTADAGIITWENNVATFEADASWTGDFTISVRGTNLCGDGEWSDLIECTLYTSPTEFNLDGDNSYCLGGDGVEITLDGSQTGVDYELYLDGISTGVIVSGTGSDISFGFVTEEGFYDAKGFNSSCLVPMSGQVQVSIDYPPLEPETPSGPSAICEELTSEYSTTDQGDADSYGWILSPEAAGTITGTGTEAQVTWDESFSGMAYVSVYGVNFCGDGNPSEVLEINVGTPTPEISGESMVCDFSDEVYEVTNNEGSIFTWEVTGGTITEGQGTNMINVSWEGVGTGSLMVNEETADGCIGSSEEFTVVIDDCTGIGQVSENILSVYPNPGTNYVYLSGDITKNLKVRVYSLSGQLKLEKEIDASNSKLDISTLPKGIFLLKVLDQNSTWGFTRLIKN